MCLSTVYYDSCNPENLLCKNVTNVYFQEGKLVLSNILGVRTEVDASIEKIDLIENYIIISSDEI